MTRWVRVAVLVALLVATAFAVRRTTRRISVYRAAERVCTAVEKNQWAAAIGQSSPDPPPTVAGLRTADCRCVALMQTGRKKECVALLERKLASPEARDWLPRPMLTAVVVESRRERGNLSGALRLATQGAERAPTHGPLLVLEGQLRLQLEPSRSALQAMAERLPRAGDSAMLLRIFLASEATKHDEWDWATKILGEEAPPPPHRDLWFPLRAQLLAHAGQAQQLMETLEDWERKGGNPAHARATYAYLLSISQQLDPRGRDPVKLLGDAMETADQIDDPDLLLGLYIRYIGVLALTGHKEEALRRFDEGVARFGSLGHLDRDDLSRTGAPEAESSLERTGATLSFELAGFRPGDTLWLSPGADEPHDAAYHHLPIPASGSLRVEHRFGASPLRWVLRDARGAVHGSGAVWPSPGSGPGGATRVHIERRQPEAAAAGPPIVQRLAAGRRRLFVIILDCADWRFVRYGEARDELPTFATFERGGTHGVLFSEPAFTAVAVSSIARAGGRRVDGVLGVFHQLGAEVAGLNFVGSNPLGGLSWLLPSAAGLFDTLGAGDLRTANLLHSYGGLQVGRHGELVGPHGAHGTIGLAATRPLNDAETTLLLRPDAENARLLAEMAVDFDNATLLASRGEPDLVVLRVASLDLLTHGGFAGAAAAGQDDGRRLLFRIYRYVDRRLGEIYRALDGNDVLVVMSDHGIRSALDHDPQAMFIAFGHGVPTGQLAGQPEIRGIPRMIADFFGVPTSWPATGVESWLHVGEGAAATGEREALTAPGR